MAKYIYPAVFEKEGEFYNVHFPDLDGCYTQGQGIADAYEMAEDALCLALYYLEEDGKEVPAASPVNDVQAQEGGFVSLVSCDTMEYRKFYDNKAVKKTLTIPSWLNTMSERAGINFSAVLQMALKKELNISE